MDKVNNNSTLNVAAIGSTKRLGGPVPERDTSGIKPCKFNSKHEEVEGPDPAFLVNTIGSGNKSGRSSLYEAADGFSASPGRGIVSLYNWFYK